MLDGEEVVHLFLRTLCRTVGEVCVVIGMRRRERRVVLLGLLVLATRFGRAVGVPVGNHRIIPGKHLEVVELCTLTVDYIHEQVPVVVCIDFVVDILARDRRLFQGTIDETACRVTTRNRLAALRLITLTSRFRGRAATDALLVTTALLQPFLSGQIQLALELWRWVLAVDEIAKSTSDAALSTVQTATSLAEVGDGTQLAVDRAAGVPARVESVASILSRILILESGVDVAHKMVVGVVADNKLLQLSVLAQLAPQVLVESVEVIGALLGSQACAGIVSRVLVHARQQNGLAVRWLDVLS